MSFGEIVRSAHIDITSWPWEMAPCSRRQIVRYLCARFTVVHNVAGDIHDTFTQTSTPFAILHELRDKNTQKNARILNL